MSMRIVPLGTNGFIPTRGRQTMSFLVLAADQALLLDAGTGVARLLDPALAALLRTYPALNIMLSHYHLDHTVGLSYLTLICSEKLTGTIYAPGSPLLQASGVEALNGLIRRPYFPITLQDFQPPMKIEPVTAESLQIGSLAIRLRAQKHNGGSVGIRIGDDIAYTTDTVVDQATATFVSGVKLLLHEVWLDDAEEALSRGHSDSRGVVQLASRSGVSSLMFVHHHPRYTMARIRRTAASLQETTTVKIIVPVEGKVYDV